MSLLDSQLLWAAAAIVVCFIGIPLFVTVRDTHRARRDRQLREDERARERHLRLCDHIAAGRPAVLFDDADLEYSNVRNIRSAEVIELRRYKRYGGDAA